MKWSRCLHSQNLRNETFLQIGTRLLILLCSTLGWWQFCYNTSVKWWSTELLYLMLTLYSSNGQGWVSFKASFYCTVFLFWDHPCQESCTTPRSTPGPIFPSLRHIVNYSKCPPPPPPWLETTCSRIPHMECTCGGLSNEGILFCCGLVVILDCDVANGFCSIYGDIGEYDLTNNKDSKDRGNDRDRERDRRDRDRRDNRERDRERDRDRDRYDWRRNRITGIEVGKIRGTGIKTGLGDGYDGVGTGYRITGIRRMDNGERDRYDGVGRGYKITGWGGGITGRESRSVDGVNALSNSPCIWYHFK